MSKRRIGGRDNDGVSNKRQRRTTSSFPSVVKRLDPLILARGSTSRWIGARTKLAILTPEEIDRDLRHMEAYANACTVYAQQYFIYSNRNLVQSGHYGTPASRTGTTTIRGEHNASFVMPVRIDPEEEKRVSQLRARIAACEKVREVLETEYVSLRAAYVYESHALEKTRGTVDSQLAFLQSLVRRRGHVVALQRVRCAMARDILSCLQHRTSTPCSDNNNDTHDKDDDILQVWNTVEMQLNEAERNLKQQEGGVMLWDARTLPRTPNDMPLYLSQLSSAPDKGAAFGCGGVFGSKTSSMCWIQRNLPETCSLMPLERAHVKHLSNTVDLLEMELQKERTANTFLQRNIANRCKRNDEMCCSVSLLRGETEAVLQRHNILLDTPEARAVAHELHLFPLQEQQQQDQSSSMDVEDSVEDEEGRNDTTTPCGAEEEEEDLNHDGDDEGDDDEEEMFEV